jgi:hypothetical protein
MTSDHIHNTLRKAISVPMKVNGSVARKIYSLNSTLVMGLHHFFIGCVLQNPHTLDNHWPWQGKQQM